MSGDQDAKNWLENQLSIIGSCNLWICLSFRGRHQCSMILFFPLRSWFLFIGTWHPSCCLTTLWKPPFPFSFALLFSALPSVQIRSGAPLSKLSNRCSLLVCQPWHGVDIWTSSPCLPSLCTCSSDIRCSSSHHVRGCCGFVCACRCSPC